MIHAGEDGVRGAVDVHGIRLERCPGPAHGERLDLIEQHNGRQSAAGEIGQCPLEEPGHAALALAEHLARERVRVDVHEEDRIAKLPSGLIREATGEGRLSGTGRTGEHDEAVDRQADATDALALGEREQDVAEESLLELGRDEDPIPALLPVGIGKLRDGDDPFDPRRHLDGGHRLGPGPPVEVIGPDHT